MRTLTRIGGFKQVLELMRAGRIDEATALQRGLQDEFLALFHENETLKRQLAEVAEVLDLTRCMAFDGQKYWLEDEDRRDGPYCQVCYDRDGTLVRLTEHDRHFQCKSCNNLYMKRELKEPVRRGQAVGREPVRQPIPLFAK